MKNYNVCLWFMVEHLFVVGDVDFVVIKSVFYTNENFLN